MAELKKLGRYELRQVLGRGAMGVVYEGFDPTLGRRVAVKTILKSVALDEETARDYSERFVKEAKAVGRLNHPHIVQVHDFGEENEVAYLVMEFIQGRELRAFFDAGEKFEPAEAVRIMGELLDALHLAHEAGVIHRDIKPANVMLDGQRRVKLADFGVARVQDSDRSAAGTMVGTPAFMSPEQIKGAKIDRRTDIFSAGTILYQLLTGEQPFKGEGAWTVAKKIVDEDPPAPSSVVRSVSPAFDAVVDKALAKNPPQRYASAKDFAAALRGALKGEVTEAPPVSKSHAIPKGGEAEVEFWRSIQNSSDIEEFETYLQEFPQGTYAQLARVKVAKLRAPLEAAAKKAAAEEAAAKKVAEDAEKAKREAEERAAQEKARQEAEAKAKREAEAKARREAEEKARLEAQEKARREAEERARKEAAEKAKREAAEKERQAKALAKLKAEEEARAKAAAAAVPVDEDATVAVRDRPAPQKKSFAVPAAIAVVLILAIGIGAYVLTSKAPPAPVATAPAPVVEKPAPPKVDVPAVDVEKIKRETEERIRKEFADKSAVEQAAMAKAAAEKEIAEKKAAAKAAAEKEIAEKKAAADKAAAEKAATARMSEEKAAAERAAAEKSAAEKLAAEKAAAEKPAAVARAVPRSLLPGAGERLVYEGHEINRPAQTYNMVVEVRSAAAGSVSDLTSLSRSSAVEWRHVPGAYLVGVGAGFVNFSPYLAGFQELRAGLRWPDLDYKNLWICNNDPIMTCSADARVAGREKVTVKSGTHDAWRIVVDLTMRRMSLNGTATLTYWFADDIKRLVKYQSRFPSAFIMWTQPSMDLELVSHSPAGARAAEPAAAKPASSAPVASAAPAAVASAKPGWPSVGDRWVYQAREVNRPDRISGIEVQVRSVSASSIREASGILGGGLVEAAHEPGAYLRAEAVTTGFSPYLLAFQQVRAGEQWSNVTAHHLSACIDMRAICEANARVVGRESVTVKAGTFDAWKVVVEVRLRGGISGGVVELIYWYSPEVRRMVKHQSRVQAPNWTQPSVEVELVSYTPAGK